MIRKGATMLQSPALWIPEKLAEAWQLKQQLGSDSQFIAGGTLLQTQWQKGVSSPSHLISLESITEMQGCGKELLNGETYTRLGALTTLDESKKSLLLIHDFPHIIEAVRSIAAQAIRNQATIGGNIANGLGDTLPAFLVMGAQLSLFDGERIQLHSVSDYIKNLNTLSRCILVSIYLTIGAKKESFFYRKVGLREAFSPSIVTVSGYCQLNNQKRIEHVRLAVGGSSALPQRLRRAEQLLKGSKLSNHLLSDVIQSIKAEFTPSTDFYSSVEYKQNVAANLLVSEIVRITGSGGERG
jgi:xanthine dehydrogenase small subunit